MVCHALSLVAVYWCNVEIVVGSGVCVRNIFQRLTSVLVKCHEIFAYPVRHLVVGCRFFGYSGKYGLIKSPCVCYCDFKFGLPPFGKELSTRLTICSLNVF